MSYAPLDAMHISQVSKHCVPHPERLSTPYVLLSAGLATFGGVGCLVDEGVGATVDLAGGVVAQDGRVWGVCRGGVRLAEGYRERERENRGDDLGS